MFFDPLYLVFAMPALLLALYAQYKVSSTYQRMSREPNMVHMSGAEVARRLLDANGLRTVNLEGTPGELSDHYDPSAKVLRLSQGVAGSSSVAALGIVAHEVGHAVQDATGYSMMRVRSTLVPAAQLGSTLGVWLFIIGFIVRISPLAWLGFALFLAAFAFTIVTLPVELDASRRAMAMLSSTRLIATTEYNMAKSVLDAAALTYVAAAAQALSQVLYYGFMLIGGRRDD
jgi:Zn-dependent membrane protease YugP